MNVQTCFVYTFKNCLALDHLLAQCNSTVLMMVSRVCASKTCLSWLFSLVCKSLLVTQTFKLWAKEITSHICGSHILSQYCNPHWQFSHSLGLVCLLVLIPILLLTTNMCCNLSFRAVFFISDLTCT